MRSAFREEPHLDRLCFRGRSLLHELEPLLLLLEPDPLDHLLFLPDFLSLELPQLVLINEEVLVLFDLKHHLLLVLFIVLTPKLLNLLPSQTG